MLSCTPDDAKCVYVEIGLEGQLLENASVNTNNQCLGPWRARKANRIVPNASP